MSRIRSHLTYANVMVTILAFIVLGGAAYAAFNLPKNSVRSRNIVNGQVKSADVLNNDLTGKDIADRSGIDTCPPGTAKYGPICGHSDGGARTWANALSYCTDRGLRLPSVSEAVVLAKKHNVPGVTSGQQFWTDEEWDISGTRVAAIVNENDLYGSANQAELNQTVCVTNPSA